MAKEETNKSEQERLSTIQKNKAAFQALYDENKRLEKEQAKERKEERNAKKKTKK